MRKGTYLLIAIVFCIGSLACGSSPERAANGANRAPPGANSEQTATGTSDQIQANNTNTSGGIATAVNRGKPLVDHPASGPPPAPQFQPAGEDSEIAVTMKPDGSIYEIRVFKSHPQLSKVEALWNGINEKTLKFYLRNGGVVEKQTDRLNNLQTASTNLLLEIAGLEPAEPVYRPGNKKKRG